MKALSFIVLIEISCILFACSVDKIDSTSEIHVKMPSSTSTVKLSDIARGSLILLPTSDSLIIDEIVRIYSSENYIYVSDVSSVYKFTRDGNFLTKLNEQGGGPDEYLNISDFFVDKEEHIWIFCRTTKKLYEFSAEHQFIKSIKVNLWVQNICPLGGDVLLYTGNEENYANSQLHLLDTSTGLIKKTFKSIDKKASRYLHVKGNNVFRTLSDGTCYFSQLFDDVIYKITSDSIWGLYHFDWDGHNIPKSLYKKNYFNVMDFFQELHSKNIYAYGVNLFLETQSSYWVSYFYKQQCFCSVLSKTGNGQTAFNQFLIDTLNDYPVNLSDVSAFVQNDGSIIFTIDAMEVKEYLSQHQVENQDIPQDSNPYLLILELKD